LRTKLLVGLLVLFCAVAISAVAAYFSVVGIAAIFAAAFLPVCIMGVILEGSKLVAAGWLHSNWKNANVTKGHKAYLTAAVITLMAITSMGIYGYLMKAHLEQKAPTAAVQIDIDQKQAQIDQLTAQRDQLLTQQKAINETVSSYLSSGKATGASQFMRQQRTQQGAIQSQIGDLNNQITQANVALAPLKKEVSGTEIKLGSLKYLAKLLNLKDPEAAVNLFIAMLMFAFDPLAVMLMISGTITIGEWQRAREPERRYTEDELLEGYTPPESYEFDPEVIIQAGKYWEERLRREAGEEQPSAEPEVAPEPVEEAPESPLEPVVAEEHPTVYAPKPEPLGTISKEEGINPFFKPEDDSFDHETIVNEFGLPETDVELRVTATKTDQEDAKAQLVRILESRPELIDVIVKAVEEVQAEHKDEPPAEVEWLSPNVK
jgi:hypothetical protein